MLICPGSYGRLGNNIQQLSNIIDIAIAYKHIKINTKKFKFLNISEIIEYFNNMIIII